VAVVAVVVVVVVVVVLIVDVDSVNLLSTAIACPANTTASIQIGSPVFLK
jgi:hypothetical protein